MNLKEYLEKLNIPSFKYVNEKFNELKENFLEMSQLKSDFDLEKFTVKREGNFIAHNFHFLMRQYSLTLGELRNQLIDKEELERKIEEYTTLLNNGEEKILIYTLEGKQEKYIDLYIKTLINQLDLSEINIADRAIRVDRYEKLRLKLIEINGGEITNEQYQNEEPHYWKWYLQRKALNQYKQSKTGVSEGVWENIAFLEEPALIRSDYQVKMLNENGFLNLEDAASDIKERQILDYNYNKRKLLKDESK